MTSMLKRLHPPLADFDVVTPSAASIGGAGMKRFEQHLQNVEKTQFWYTKAIQVRRVS